MWYVGFGQFLTVAVMSPAVQIGAKEYCIRSDLRGEISDVAAEAVAHKCIADVSVTVRDM